MLRLFAILFALLVAGGEVLRSWGERSIIWWLDDFLVAAALVGSAVALGVESMGRRAMFSAAWGFAVGVIYISFFDKVVLAMAIGPGAELNRVNAFVTLSLVLAVAGLVASFVVPFKTSA